MGRIKNVHLVAILAIVLVAFMTVGYAYVNENITNTNAKEQKSWNVGFNTDDYTASGTAEDGIGPVISKNNIKFEVNFSDPGQYKTYTFEVLNKGNINAILDNIKVISNSNNASDLSFAYTVYKGENTITSSLTGGINKQYNHLYRSSGTNIVEVTIMYNGKEEVSNDDSEVYEDTDVSDYVDEVKELVVGKYELDMTYTQAE